MPLSRLGSSDSRSLDVQYWDAATYFELGYLEKKYKNALEAAEKMVLINAPSWCLASTLKNIKLILRKNADEGARVDDEDSRGIITDVLFKIYFLEN